MSAPRITEHFVTLEKSDSGIFARNGTESVCIVSIQIGNACNEQADRRKSANRNKCLANERQTAISLRSTSNVIYHADVRFSLTIVRSRWWRIAKMVKTQKSEGNGCNEMACQGVMKLDKGKKSRFKERRVWCHLHLQARSS